MITLKKSFELQNYLKSLFDKSIFILSYTDNITSTKQEHMRKKVYAEAEDEVIIKPKHNDYSFTINELIDFVCYIQNTMEELTKAINHAKHQGDKDFDGMIAINSRKRALLSQLIEMSNVRPKENIVSGQSVKFNEEGNQTTYSYDIKEITTIDFNRNKVKAIEKRLRKELDETSTNIDIMQLETMVDFENIFEIGDSLEDAINLWKSTFNTTD